MEFINKIIMTFKVCTTVKYKSQRALGVRRASQPTAAVATAADKGGKWPPPPLTAAALAAGLAAVGVVQ